MPKQTFLLWMEDNSPIFAPNIEKETLQKGKIAQGLHILPMLNFTLRLYTLFFLCTTMALSETPQ